MKAWFKLFEPKNRFERFSEEAMESITLAHEEGRMLKHNFISSEQILLGLIREEKGVVAQALKILGVNIENARDHVIKIVGIGSSEVSQHPPFTPRAELVIKLSLEEADVLHSKKINTEHLLLAITGPHGEGVAARALQNLGLDFKNVRATVIEILKRQIVHSSQDVI